ncbi:MAG: ferrous iron transport protein B [Bacteroidales bacterium]|nr:ferrous iron transport protein B [Bacteroidales bacterium]MCF8333314.1 ferrous iron transport protein B [Bacteroidales bacterium]
MKEEPIIQDRKSASGSCHGTKSGIATAHKWIALTGQPNVGKSLLFNRLTGSRVAVSNYPGTTVAIDKGQITIDQEKYEIRDLPGMYSFLPITEEERVAKMAVMYEQPEFILHVVDAKNLTRMLPLAMELSETGRKVILVVNMIDEAEREGIAIDFEGLSQKVGIPVIPTSAVTGKGINELVLHIMNFRRKNHRKVIPFEATIENALEKIQQALQADYPVDKRTIAQLLLQQDSDTVGQIKKNEENSDTIQSIADETQEAIDEPLVYRMKLEIHKKAERIAREVTSVTKTKRLKVGEYLNNWMTWPVTGIPILFAILYFVLYKFVGVFGAGTLVDYLEGVVFGEHIIPAIASAVKSVTSSEALRQLVIGEYGLLTLGLTYSIAIILPVVGTFFLAFSVIEDSGYLPRLSLLIDRVFKKIGLSGRAVIPMVLGLGCDTMATIVTRTQETKRERMIATILLALAIPCSAQLGVIFALLAPAPMALLVWVVVIIANFMLVGFLASKIMPGQKPTFFMELPPLRMPKASNVFSKTYTRIVWYLKEVLPLFLIASVVIWLLQISGVFPHILKGLEPLVSAIGLPEESSKAFLFGFFRRDYGAAGLYELQGLLNANQLAISAVVLTLFVPCIAQLMVMFKERGAKTAAGIFVFVLVLAFSTGWLLHLALQTFGINL